MNIVSGYEIGLTVAAFVITSGLVLALGRLLKSTDQRLQVRLNESASRPAPRGRDRLLAGALPKLGARLLPDNEQQRSRLRNRLSRAGIYSPYGISSFLTFQLALRCVVPCLGLVGASLGYFAWHWAVIAGLAGMLAPSFWLNRRAAQRQIVFASSLPDFLDLLVACLEGGQSIQAAMQRVADELRIAHPVLSQEMSIVQREIELGGTPAAALRHFAERSGTDSIRSLSTFVEQTQRFGTALAEALRIHADVLRTQREQLAEERAQRAAVKILFPTLLFIFPAIFVVLAGPAAIQLHEHFSRSSPPLAQGANQ
jgi:tight adherence protein C